MSNSSIDLNQNHCTLLQSREGNIHPPVILNSLSVWTFYSFSFRNKEILVSNKLMFFFYFQKIPSIQSMMKLFNQQRCNNDDDLHFLVSVACCFNRFSCPKLILAKCPQLNAERAMCS